MEVTEIKEALQSQTNIGSQSDLLIFLQKVLGYVLAEDIVINKLTPPLQSTEAIKVNPKIKFAVAIPPKENLTEDEQKKWVLDLAQTAATTVVMLPQHNKITFYSIDWEDNRQIDVLVEVDLTRDDPEDVAQQLWALAKKDCGRKIVVGV